MTPSYFCQCVLLGLLCICSYSAANITLHSSPKCVVSTDKNVETAFYCWAIHDLNNAIVSVKHNGLSLDVSDDRSLIRIAPGQCSQDLVPDGMHCENITVHIPGDMSLDQTTIMCSLLQLVTEGGFSNLIESNERLSVTILIADETTTTPDCDCTGPTTNMSPVVSENATDTAFVSKTVFIVIVSVLVFSILLNIVLAVALAYCCKSYKASRKDRSFDPENPEQSGERPTEVFSP